MAVVFDLSQNPFHLIGAPLDASAEDIVDLSQDAVLEGRADEVTVAKAQQTLIPPRLRLEAEVGWFADVSPETVAALSDRVIGASLDNAVISARGAAPLARANAGAHLCGRFPKSKAPLSLLVGAWNDLDRGEVFQAIAAARQRAGFPRPDREHFDDALKKLEATHARQAVKSIEGQDEPGRALTDMVEMAIGRQALGPMLRQIVREYDRASEPQLEAVREKMMGEVNRCRTVPGTAPEVVERLRRLLSEWDDINQPVQLLEQAEGHEEERSRQLCQELRNLALWLANEQRRHREALVLTRALLETFPELDSVAAQLRKDVRILEEILRDLPRSPISRAGNQRSTPQHPATRGSSRSLFWPIVAVILVGIVVVAALDDPPRRSSSTSSPALSRPAVVPPTSTAQQTRSPPSSTAEPTPAETAPPLNIRRALTTAELRYCVFQGARLDHLRRIVSSASEREINLFNGLIRDFNARCGNFTYRAGALAPVEAEARRRDAELRREASAILTEWRSAATPRAAPQPPATPQGTATPLFRPPPVSPPPTRTPTIERPPAESPSVSTGTSLQPPRLLDLRIAEDARIVQRRLRELGYYQASIDGGFGPMSVAALRAFKRDHPRLPADDEWDFETQRALLNQ